MTNNIDLSIETPAPNTEIPATKARPEIPGNVTETQDFQPQDRPQTQETRSEIQKDPIDKKAASPYHFFGETFQMRHKSVELAIRCEPTIAKLIKAVASHKGMTVSRYVRNAVIMQLNGSDNKLAGAYMSIIKQENRDERQHQEPDLDILLLHSNTTEEPILDGVPISRLPQI